MTAAPMLACLHAAQTPRQGREFAATNPRQAVAAERALALLRNEGLIASAMGRGHFVVKRG